MPEPVSDESVLLKIETLVSEEQRLYGENRLADEEVERLRKIQVELDRCWDLLRQRRARREFGDDPDAARVRPASVVEGYEQ
jgi:Protein of unknown function (DUF2630)